MIEKIAKIASANDYFVELYNKLENLTFYGFLRKNLYKDYKFSNKELNDLLRFADIFASSNNAEFRNHANRIVANLYEFYSDNFIYNSYAVSIFTKMGLFPSIDILSNGKEVNTSNDIKLTKLFKQKIQYDKDLGVVYTDKQFEVVQNLAKKNNYSLSAPTSFGKTMIISNFINNVIKDKKNCNICILVPTNALLKEVSMDMKSKYENKVETRIKVINYPELKSKDLKYDNLIFVFTPERLVEYFANSKIDIEYLFVDEAQKILKMNDERSPVFYNAISYSSYKGSKLFFLSPNINNPEIFLSLANRDETNSCKVEDKLVTQNKYLFNFSDNTVQFVNYKNEILKTSICETNVYRIADAVKIIFNKYLSKTSTIVYFSSKHKMIKELLKYIEDEPESEDQELKNLSEFVSASIHEKYFLVKALKKGVAFHYGQMPKNIREKIEDLFKSKKIKILFTTSTLLEGVNIQAKNIILTSDDNGKHNLTQEDFLNLIGRAGRFKSELFGNVICLKGVFENSYRYKYLCSNSSLKLKSQVLNSTRGNFYKDIKQIIQNKNAVTKNLKSQHTECLIREQYANIAILHNKLSFDSKLRSNLINANTDPDIFKNINRDKNSVDKLEEFKEYIGIPIIYQQSVYKKSDYEVQKKYKNFNIKDMTPQDIKYLTEKIFIEYDLYNRGLVEFPKSYLYYSNLLISWIDGYPLNFIISNVIEKISDGTIKFLLDYDYQEKKYNHFTGSDDHINLIINDVLEKIENDIKHLLKLYFSNYINLNIKNGSMNSSLKKLVDYIEFGTKNNKIIELQKYGFSRELSSYLLKKHEQCLLFDSNLELIDINFNKLFSEFNVDEILYEELKEYSYEIED